MIEALERTDLENSSFSMDYRKPKYPVTILMPYVDGIRGPVVASLLYYAKHFDVGFELQGNTLIANARNQLANRFLEGSSEWSFWLDSDVFIPYGSADTFLGFSGATRGQAFAQHNTLLRMLSHNAPLVGGCYAGRVKRAPLTIQPDLAPRNPNDQRISEALRSGKSAGGLQAVGWVAAGLMLVHRKVFERIMEHQPLKGTNGAYPFFSQGTRTDEDIVFCERAIAAGVQPMLDTEVRAAHIGLGMWLPEDSQPVLRMRGGDAQMPLE
jgi:hypothetical protein